MSEERDTAWYIWEPMYFCQVPQLATRSELDLRIFGMPTSGNPEVDRATNNQWLDMYITIAQMVEFHQKGASVKIIQHSDTLQIYQRIQNHLDAWAQEVKKGWATNRIQQVKDDLVAMDQFATTIYPHARNHFNDPVPESAFARALAAMASPFTPPAPVINEDPEVIERAPMTEIFTSMAAPEGFRWK